MSFNLKKNPGVIPIVAYVFNRFSNLIVLGLYFTYHSHCFHRPNQLRKLLSSLELVEGINDTILVISHDGSNEEMWKMVEQINFCEVLQITHPSVYFIPETVPSNKIEIPLDVVEQFLVGCCVSRSWKETFFFLKKMML